MWLDDRKKLSRIFKQAYRIYSSEGIACSITANGCGIGGYTGLYIVELGINYMGNFNLVREKYIEFYKKKWLYSKDI